MVKKIHNFYLIYLLIFFMQVSISAASEKVYGIWMYGSTLSSQGTETVINKLKENYVRQVYLLVKGTSGSLSNAAVLNDFILKAHANDIEVHFWYVVSQDAEYLKNNPSSVIYHCPKPGTNNNNPYPMTGDANSRINLLYPGYKEYVLQNITYLLNNFDCDGIHLDYIRYHHLVYSFDTNHLDKANSLGCNTQRLLGLFLEDYAKYTGLGFNELYINGDEDIVKWIEMRKSVVQEYTAAIKNILQQVKPGAELSAAFLPEGATDTITANIHYGQNYKSASTLLDRIVIMSYHKDYNETTKWLEEITEGAKSKVEGNCLITTGYQINSDVSPAEIKECFDYALIAGSSGAAGFRYELVNSAQWNIIKDCYKGDVPVELGLFSAEVIHNKVVLRWKTITETNNQGFEIQRKNIGGNWNSVGYIPGSGTCLEEKIYIYEDYLTEKKCYYRLKQIDYDGTFTYSEIIEVEIKINSYSYKLMQNYPNPFNPETHVEFELPEKSIVKLEVFNISGELVRVLCSGYYNQGNHKINFNAANLPGGRYLYRLRTSDFSQTKSMLLIK